MALIDCSHCNASLASPATKQVASGLVLRVSVPAIRTNPSPAGSRNFKTRVSASQTPQEPLALGQKPDFPSGRLAGPTQTQSSQAHTNSPYFEEELEKLLRLLPEKVAATLLAHPEKASLVEVVLDLGRAPLARFPSGDWQISDELVSTDDLHETVSKVGQFGGDNRAGVDRTLHRISAIRNRAGRVVGLTCRVGRAIAGGSEIVRDLVAQGGSLLLMGPPGVGKTTAIRDVARLLADEYHRRVVVVDTSNEIGGDGDVPHPGIGRARRMQVPEVDRQHEVMIEAVENHMPQTIVIDEIGTELEAAAAGTISQRGVQLVATAHGMSVDNLIKNPSLQDLAGGIQSVTLGDEEARRRGVQKSVLERKGPPVFECAVEMLSRATWRVHRNLASTVDSLLVGKTPVVEIRTLTPTGQVAKTGSSLFGLDEALELGVQGGGYSSGARLFQEDESDSDSETDTPAGGNAAYDFFHATATKPLVLYLYQVSLDSLEQVLEVMGVEAVVTTTDDVGDADAVLALRSKLKQNAWLRGIAKFRQLPIYAIKSNTMPQMVRAMRAILGFDSFGPGLKQQYVSDAGPIQSDPLDRSASSGGLFGEAPFLDQTGLSSPGGGVSDLGLAGLAGLAGANGVDETERDADGAAVAAGVDDSWLAVGSKASLEDEIDALEEARLAVEQIVLPLGTPVELLPRSPHVLDLQTKLLIGLRLESERVGAHPSCRIRILPHGMAREGSYGQDSGHAPAFGNEGADPSPPANDMVGTQGTAELSASQEEGRLYDSLDTEDRRLYSVAGEHPGGGARGSDEAARGSWSGDSAVRNRGLSGTTQRKLPLLGTSDWPSEDREV